MTRSASADEAAEASRQGRRQEVDSHARRSDGNASIARNSLGTLRQLTESSPQVALLLALQQHADESPHARQRSQLQARADAGLSQGRTLLAEAVQDSPLVAQRFQTAGAVSNVIQRLNPQWLHEADRGDFDAFIQNIRTNAAEIPLRWGHINYRHVVERGMEEGELRSVPDNATAYFLSDNEQAIHSLVIEAIANGQRYWNNWEDKIWFIHDFGRHIGGYPDGRSAKRLKVYINTSDMRDSGDTDSALITTAFPII